MNCQEVQAELSEYLDASLDAVNLEIIENHLSQCLLCRSEADRLRECVRYVGDLPAIDPPIGFAQRVMARAREIERRPSFWERLLFPLRIKIPIQATAVVVIGIFAVYLLNKEQPHKQSLITNEAIVSKNQATPLEQSGKAPEPAAVLQQGPTKPNALADTRPQSSGTPPSTAVQPKSPVASKLAVAGGANSVAEKRSDSSEPSLSLVESRGRTGGIISGTPVINAGGASGQFPSPTEFENTFLRSGPVSIEPFADYEMVFRLKSQLQDQARRDNPAPSQKSSTRALAERQATPGALDRLLEAVADSTRPQTIWLTVPKSQYEQLKKELRAVGTIESEEQIPLLRAEPGAQNNGQLQIKLTVLPAPEANRTTPSSPNDR